MELEIINAEISEPEMLKVAIDACTRWASAERAVIYVEARVPMDAPEHKHPGWCEYACGIYRSEGTIPMRLGVIQRKPGAEIEVHS